MRKIYFKKYVPYDPMKVWGTHLLNGLEFAMSIFRASHQIKNADKIKEGLISNGNPAVIAFGETDLFDSIRILIFFENYVKYKLLIEGYEVFVINGKDYPELKIYYKEQKEKPVKSSIVYQEKYYKRKNPNEWFYNNAISEKTLNFKTISNPTYNQIVNIPPDIISYLEGINERRNGLHFLGYEGNIYSSTISTDMQKLRDYAEKIYRDLNNELVIGTGISKTQLIP